MQTAGGIDNDGIAGQMGRLVQRLTGNLYRGNLVAQRKHGNAYLFPQHLQLGNSSGTVYIGGYQQGALLFPFQVVSQLANSSGLTGALEAYQHDDGGRLVRYRQLHLGTAQQFCQFFVNDLDDLLAGAQVLLDLRP